MWQFFTGKIRITFTLTGFTSIIRTIFYSAAQNISAIHWVIAVSLFQISYIAFIMTLKTQYFRFFDSNPRICNFNGISHFFTQSLLLLCPQKLPLYFNYLPSPPPISFFSNHHTCNFMLFHLPFTIRPKNADIGQLVHYLLVYTNFNQIIIIFKKCQYFSN